jgi:hypothetical protein
MEEVAAVGLVVLEVLWQKVAVETMWKSQNPTSCQGTSRRVLRVEGSICPKEP